MTLRSTLAAGLTTFLLAGSFAACGSDDSEDSTTPEPSASIPAATVPAVPDPAAGAGVERLGSTDEGRDDLIACLTEAGVEAEPVTYTGVASGPDAEYHFDGPATEVHLREEEKEGAGEEHAAEDEHGHGGVATVLTFADEADAERLHDAWSATAESVLAGDSVVIAEPGAPIDDAGPVQDCLDG